MTSKRILSVDLETFSDVDIKLGVYRYVNTPNFCILLCAYAFNDDPVQVVSLAEGETLPDEFIKALTDPLVEVHAFNATFERVCLSKALHIHIPPDTFWCTQAHAKMYGLPASLDKVATVLELEEQKDKAGVYLINYFSKPCKPTKANGGRTRNLPAHAPEKWELFKKYCAQDVNTERAISHYLDSHYSRRLDAEKRNYRINEEINDRGILIDRKLCEAVVDYNNQYSWKALKRSQELTGLENPNSLSQLKDWLDDHGCDTSHGITKDTVPDMIASAADPAVKEVLQIRADTSKSSVKKYEMMLNCMCSDQRVHGVMNYYGANRTGRYAGRLIQTQNLPRNYMPELGEVREIVKQEDWSYIECMYDDPQDVFKQLIRTALIAPEGKTFAVADYSAIEARTVAWLAGEQWVLDVFAQGKDIYCETASQAFGVPVEKHGVNSHLRQRGKVMVLALGYGGSVGAMRAMDTGKILIDEPDSEILDMVNRWRKTNPRIVRFWGDAERCAKQAIQTGVTQDLRNMRFKYRYGNLFIQLPSGRWLTYFNASLVDGQIRYYGTSDRSAWVQLETWGGKLVENITQAVARDCIADSLVNLIDHGFDPVFHVHDEIICEIPKDSADEKLKEMEQIMSSNNGVWDKGLLHPAPGFTTDYYLKD